MANEFSLMSKRRFLPLFATQFMGALNDNAFKNALLAMLAYKASEWTTMSVATLSAIAPAAFMLPFFLFSALAGQIADKFDKAAIIRWVKIYEILIACAASVCFYERSLALAFATLFMFGMHSAFFGPVKYAILPQALNEDELTGGNGLMEAGTFLAILVGTSLGSVMGGASEAAFWASAAILSIAAIGAACSRFVPSAPSSFPDLKVSVNPFSGTWETLRLAAGERLAFVAILRISWFWAFGLAFLSELPEYASAVLHGKPYVTAFLLGLFTVGIGWGSLSFEPISRRFGRRRIASAGSWGMAFFAVVFGTSILFSKSSPSAVGLLDLFSEFNADLGFFSLLSIGFFGGWYCVPSYVDMQEGSPAEARSRVVAANNVMNAVFMIASSVLTAFALSGFVGLGLGETFVGLGVLGGLAHVFAAPFGSRIASE